ncbi:MAG TPA: hypothetical protein VND40_00860 [Nitrososphaerales archaeon]|nr:hypothetical protein [Nitrososphaerales archaeon]
MALSIVVVIARLAFVLPWAIYWSSGYGPFQSIIVTMVSHLVDGLVVGLMRTPWVHISGERRLQNLQAHPQGIS